MYRLFFIRWKKVRYKYGLFKKRPPSPNTHWVYYKMGKEVSGKIIRGLRPQIPLGIYMTGKEASGSNILNMILIANNNNNHPRPYCTTIRHLKNVKVIWKRLSYHFLFLKTYRLVLSEFLVCPSLLRIRLKEAPFSYSSVAQVFLKEWLPIWSLLILQAVQIFLRIV